MNRFFKTFFSEVPASPTDLTIFAFGKHPGWDDHIEGIGIDNETLAICRSVFYVHGIGGLIDSGIWEKSDPVQIVPEFGNLILWQGRRAFLSCRMWPSKDGKGRAKYPMIIGIYGGGVCLTRAFPMIVPVLERLEDECKMARTADEVRQVLENGRIRLKENIGTLSGSHVVPPLSSDEYGEMLAPNKAIPDATGWHRILYTMQNQLEIFGLGHFSIRAMRPESGGQHLRVPLLNDSPTLSMLAWLRLLRGEIDPQVPVFVSTHHGRGWCDLLIGEPATNDFSFLKLNPEGIPYANDIPYNLGAEKEAELDQVLDAFRQRREPGFSALFPNGKAGQDSGGGKGWIRSIFGWRSH